MDSNTSVEQNNESTGNKSEDSEPIQNNHKQNSKVVIEKGSKPSNELRYEIKVC